MNYIDKYNEYVSFLKTDKYKKYIDSLHLFFNNNPNQLCPQCNKPTIIKSYNNGIIFMKCTQSKCDWKMSIEVAEYINLDNTIYKNKKISKDLLYSLLNTDNFTAVKNEYLNEKNKINYINEIFKIQQKELDDKITEKIKLYSELSLLYYKRKNVFAQIEKSLDNKLKKSLLEIYKNEYKTMKDSRYNNISKQFNISINDVKNILLWFDISFEYIEKQTKLNKFIKNIKDYEKDINNINNNMMIKLPIIKEGKDVNFDEKKLESNKTINIDTSSLILNKKENTNQEEEGENTNEEEGENTNQENTNEEEEENTNQENTNEENTNEEEEENTDEENTDEEEEENTDEENTDEEEEIKNIKTISINKDLLKTVDENMDKNIGENMDVENIDSKNLNKENPGIIPKSSGEKRIKLKISKK